MLTGAGAKNVECGGSAFVRRVATCARAKAVLARHERLLAQLEAFEERAFVEWAAALPEQVERNLRKPLLARVPSARGAGALLLNFDPELSAMIREVHYLKLMGRSNIPPEAMAMYERGKTFRKYTDNLGQTVLW
ncbi:Dynein beta chain, ciliary [Gryllus bimaculatus]|nr:Dynein beta chain, ciliary [Gryllus bimaculatus]